MCANDPRCKGRKEEVDTRCQKKNGQKWKDKEERSLEMECKWSLLSKATETSRELQTKNSPLEATIRKSQVRREIAIECDQFGGTN